MNQDANPKPTAPRKFMARLPIDLHVRLMEAAHRERYSANKLCIAAIKQLCEQSEAGLLVVDTDN